MSKVWLITGSGNGLGRDIAQAALAAAQPGLAATAAAEARRLAPNEPDVHFLSGKVSLARSDLAVAREHQERALALDPAHSGAMNELGRVLRPGGLAAITVPSFLPERICWALSTEYHEVPGGHVRIYTRVELEAKLARAGLSVGWHHYAHGLHSPFWWLKCAVGVHQDKNRLTSAYHRMLVWDIMRQPAATRLAEQTLNPVVGKSLVVYAVKQGQP